MVKKNQRTRKALTASGITLVALVVTIIVLLILAGVSLNLVSGSNGILGRATNAVDKNRLAGIKEDVELAMAQMQSEYYEAKYVDRTTSGTFAEYATEQMGGTGYTTSNGAKLTISGTTVTYTGSNGDTTSGTFNSSTGAVAIAGTTTSGETPQEQTPTETTILKEASYIGSYADINGDGTIDGIIYVDLLDTAHLSGTWNGDRDSEFSITTDVTSSNVKDYVVSATNQTDTRWSTTEQKNVIKLATTGTGTKDRFYVMGLDNITAGTNNTLYWYKSATGSMSDYASTTSGDFGTGKANTTTMRTKWTNSSYGSQDSRDLWGNIASQVSNGWFIPSRAEWSAFGNNLGISTSNYSGYGLADDYWSSSQSEDDGAWFSNFDSSPGFMSEYEIDNEFCVRTCATF